MKGLHSINQVQQRAHKSKWEWKEKYLTVNDRTNHEEKYDGQNNQRDYNADAD